MKLYKLTDENDQTHGGCQWGPGVTVETDGQGELCGPGFTHWYTDPLLAVLLNPIHGAFSLETAHLWKGEGEIAVEDNGLKVGCVKATTTKRIPLPVVTIEQCVRFAILCVLQMRTNDDFCLWADKWLTGEDQTKEAARAAARAAAWAAAYAAADAAADAAAGAAEAAAYAARAAADAAA